MSDSASTGGPADQATALLAQAAELVRQAEEANRKANSEAGFAFNAKQMAEDHARTISEVKGRVESDVGWFTTTRQGIEQAQAAIVTARAEAEASQRATAEASTEVEKGRTSIRAVVADMAELAAAAQTTADQVREMHKSVSQQSASAAEQKTAAETAAKRVAELLDQVTGQAVKAQEQAAQIGIAAVEVDLDCETSKALVAAMTKAEQRATQVLAIVQQHETDLAGLKEQCELLHKRIESLLPNATSAGLATAFRDQKARFVKPQWWWLGTFIVSILLLLISSLTGLPAVNDTWDAMALHLLNRLPLIAPLVWLAVYAGRHYGLALRLQEEYAYKEAVSFAFEGYKREMAGVGSSGEDGHNPLVTLCENVLRTLGQRPGRIYEGRHEDITPFTPAANAIRDGVAAAAGALKG
jgi:hypothetical protein